MEVTFCKDLTYGFEQYPIALVNDSKEEINSFEGKYIGSKIASSIKSTCVRVKEIMELLPEIYMIDHIIGEHSGQCHPFDCYTHVYDGYILGYGNQDAAILFEHYHSNPDFDHLFNPDCNEFISVENVNWIELNIHKPTKDNLEMLISFCKKLEAIMDKKFLVCKHIGDKMEFYDLESFKSQFHFGENA
jgi:hypothetical protein